jgi:hypothetical protein
MLSYCDDDDNSSNSSSSSSSNNNNNNTNRNIPNNKLDITICDNKQGTCMSIDVAIPGNRKVIKKEYEKI